MEIIALEDTGLEGTSEELVDIVDASWALSPKEFVGTYVEDTCVSSAVDFPSQCL